MERITFITFLLTAVFSFSACVANHYHFVNINLNWTEAQRYCRVNYTDLATINSKTDIDEMMKTVKDESVQRVWIGLHKTQKKTWKWSLGNPAFYTGNDSHYQNWESNNIHVDGDCVCMDGQNGKWDNTKCEENKNFICYNASSEEYIFNSPGMNWRDAQRFCREKHTDLASVRNQNENQTIQNIINNHQGSEKAWFGLFRDSWEWSDLSESSFRDGILGENDKNTENCTAVSLVGPHKKYQYWNCDKSFPFVCYNKFVLIQQNLTWNEALKYCRDNHVDLVSVESQQIQNSVMNVVKKASTAAVWLGLRQACALGIWFWVNGEIVCYQDWAAGNGTGVEDCSDTAGAVQSGDNQTWISLPQTDKLNFICTNYEA
ncbi:macrophage mannose receptor 1-like isoform X2 [Xyrauchen texanus]|nr:macrophage mannose receptor 1-like isoform X2 [Xyrauchen texanus]XP_051947391.1 macrophage mannose receptor 1-like isoform X2 [Xyrauchen texanus]XP_051947394.1 macrophage mannose receptor 1-like isoform X2 [Xyrauchen texanus]